MIPRRIGVLVAAGLATAAAAFIMGGPGTPAYAADKTAQTSYSCQIQGGSGSSPVATETMTLAITLDLPASVTPGQSLALSGTLRLAFPEEVAQLAKTAGFTTASGYSDTMSLQVDRKVFTADRWQTPQIPIGDPLVVSAPISFPTLTVPNTPGGTLDLVMAQNNMLKNPYFSSPASIAFTAVAQANGAVGSASFNLACYLSGGAPSTLARIPIQAATRAAQQQPATREKAQQVAASAQGGAAAATPGPVPVSSAAATARPLPSGANAGSPAPQSAVTTDATPTAAQRQNGIYLPTGMLIGAGAIICLLALLYAAWAHYRLHQLRRMLDE